MPGAYTSLQARRPLIQHALDELEILVSAVEVFVQGLLDHLPGVHHAHGDVLDVFLGRRFDLRVGHESPLPTLASGWKW